MGLPLSIRESSMESSNGVEVITAVCFSLWMLHAWAWSRVPSRERSERADPQVPRKLDKHV
jgi:hypothetical protein